MTPRPFGSYKFYRRAPGRKLYKGAAGGAPAQSCVQFDTYLQTGAGHQSAPSVYRINATDLLISVNHYNGGLGQNEFMVYKSIDNGASWVQKFTYNMGAGGGRMHNCGLIDQDNNFYAFYTKLLAGNASICWTKSVDFGENWTAHADATALDMPRAFGNDLCYHVTNWEIDGQIKDHNVVGLGDQRALFVGSLKAAANNVQIIRYLWNGGAGTWRQNGWLQTPITAPHDISVLTDDDYTYIACTKTAAPNMVFMRNTKGAVSGGSGGAGGQVTLAFTNQSLWNWPNLWTRGGDAKVNGLYYGFARTGTVLFDHKLSGDQGSSFAGEVIGSPAWACAVKNFRYETRLCNLENMGAGIYDVAFTEAINAKGWFERA